MWILYMMGANFDIWHGVGETIWANPDEMVLGKINDTVSDV